MVEVVKHWNGLHGEVVEPPALEVLRNVLTWMMVNVVVVLG